MFEPGRPFGVFLDYMTDSLASSSLSRVRQFLRNLGHFMGVFRRDIHSILPFHFMLSSFPQRSLYYKEKKANRHGSS